MKQSLDGWASISVLKVAEIFQHLKRGLAVSDSQEVQVNK